MALFGSLLGVTSRLAETARKKAAATGFKFINADPTGGGSTPILTRSIPGSVITTLAPMRPALPGPSRQSIGLPPLSTFGPGINPFATPLAAGSSPFEVGPGGVVACNFLTGRAKELCLLGLSLLPGGVTPGEAIRTGGTPAIPARTGSSEGVTTGAFGLPAAFPAGVVRNVLSCGPRMVLGIDNLCYPKAVLPPRSKFRKWRRPPRVPITRRDVVAIRRAASAKDRVFELAQDVGIERLKRPRKKK